MGYTTKRPQSDPERMAEKGRQYGPQSRARKADTTTRVLMMKAQARRQARKRALEGGA